MDSQTGETLGDEINDCKRLFLSEIEELGHNSLRVVVAEGLPAGPPKTIEAGGVTIPNCTPIEVIDESRIFEVVWDLYVGYTVLNESYASVDKEERGEGSRFRLYSKSRFIDYMSRATFACDDYPGPTRHCCLACEDHILHVLSLDAPVIRKIR